DLESVHGSLDVDAEIVGGVLQRVGDVGVRGHVEDDIWPSLLAGRRGLRRDGDAASDQLRAVGQRALDVLLATGAEVVEDRDLVATRQQRVDEGGTDMSGTAGDKSSHQFAPEAIGEVGAPAGTGPWWCPRMIFTTTVLTSSTRYSRGGSQLPPRPSTALVQLRIASG